MGQELTLFHEDYTVGDFNGDGFQDVLTLSFSDYYDRVRIALGNGDGTFSFLPGFVEVSASSLRTGDINGDGLDDIIVNSSQRIDVALGPDGEQSSFRGDNVVDVRIGDVGNDGTADLIIANGNRNHITVMLNLSLIHI